MRAGRIREDFSTVCVEIKSTRWLCMKFWPRTDEIIGSVHYICSRLFGPEEQGTFIAVVDTLREQVPKLRVAGTFVNWSRLC